VQDSTLFWSAATVAYRWGGGPAGISDFGFRILNLRRGEALRPIGICCPRLGVTTTRTRTLRARCTADVNEIASHHATRDNPSAGGRIQVPTTIPRAGKFEIRNSAGVCGRPDRESSIECRVGGRARPRILDDSGSTSVSMALVFDLDVGGFQACSLHRRQHTCSPCHSTRDEASGRSSAVQVVPRPRMLAALSLLRALTSPSGNS